MCHERNTEEIYGSKGSLDELRTDRFSTVVELFYHKICHLCLIFLTFMLLCTNYMSLKNSWEFLTILRFVCILLFRNCYSHIDYVSYEEEFRLAKSVVRYELCVIKLNSNLFIVLKTSLYNLNKVMHISVV
jgi:hypothetical protein